MSNVQAAAPGGTSGTDSTHNVTSSTQMSADRIDIDIDPTESEPKIDDCQPIKKKGRQTTSDVWKHFDKVSVNGVPKAKCKYCDSLLMNRQSDGTSSLDKHIKRQHPSKCVGTVGQMFINVGEKKKDGTMNLKIFVFDQNISRTDLANMIILHEYPFSMVEHVAFREFVRNLQPQFQFVSRNTIKKDCVIIYEKEKEKLYKVLDKLTSRVTMTTDMWTSIQNKGYFSLTGHYIDDEWRLHKNILNFSDIDAPHTADNLTKAILEKLFQWNLDKKFMCLVVDNCTTNDAMVRELSKKLTSRGCLIAQGKLVHVRCCAHILNLIAQEGVDVIKSVTSKIRESVKYVKGSVLRSQLFKEVASQVRAPQKALILDVSTRWNSTFLMLKHALEFKDAFIRFADRDASYKYLPSEVEWDNAKLTCDCLEIFYDVTNIFSSTLYPSANYYFNNICAVHIHLKELSSSDTSFVAKMGKEMMSKFKKYWDVSCLILSIASIVDPRLKMKSVEYNLREIYGNDIDDSDDDDASDGGNVAQKKIDQIKGCLVDLYNEYRLQMGGTNFEYIDSTCDRSGCLNDTSGHQKPSSRGLLKILGRFDNHLQKVQATQPTRTDLDLYLEEAIHPKQIGGDNLVDTFDILQWWKLNCAKYPVVARMARDILAIPVSTVASEAAFSTGGRVLDQYRSSLKPNTVEALICAQDWMRSNMCGQDCGGTMLGSVRNDLEDEQELGDVVIIEME